MHDSKCTQSLKFKMDELREIIDREKPHIISVTETWGKERMGDAIFSVDGYNIYRNDRGKGTGGGTLLYISKKLGQRACRPLNEIPNEQHFDSNIWCWVTPTRTKKILVGSIYRSPTSTRENNRLLLRQMDRANNIAGDNRLLIMGDFNIPNIDWVTRDVLVGAPKVDKDLFKKMQDYFLYQHVTKPTRFRGNSSSN